VFRKILPLLYISVLISCSNNNDDIPELIPETIPIGEFVSVIPSEQTTDFIIPRTHTFQKIIETGDLLTGGGTLPARTDFTGYVPINERSTKGYLSISSETSPGGVTVLDIHRDRESKLWQVSASEAVDFSNVGGTSDGPLRLILQQGKCSISVGHLVILPMKT